MKFKQAILVPLWAALMAASPILAAGGPSVVVTKGELAWKDMGNGVAAAPVSGDMQKGASRFFLKYPVCLVTPMHHHNADHYVTVVSGSITLTVEGKDHKLGPGDYFELTKKAPHVAKVEGKDAAVFFIQADAPWDVVMAE
jgi:mannose-6-phosphate isomerase-like protein (cupin superfamily)